MSAHLLLVEGEPDLLVTLGDVLRGWGYELDMATSSEAALAQTELRVHDLIILDVTLRERSGLEVWKELQRRKVRTPVLMLTVMDETNANVRGLCIASEDHMTKLCAMGELQARIEALLPRQREVQSLAVYEFAGMRVDFAHATLTRNCVVQILTEREAQLLRYLVENRGAIVTREALMLAVWGWTSAYTTTVDVHILRLRQKIETDARVPKFIVSVQGGYQFTG